MLLSYNSILGMPVNETDNSNIINDNSNIYEINPFILITFIVVIGIFIIIFSSLESNTVSSSQSSFASPSKGSSSASTLEILVGGVVIVVLFFSAFQYIFNINITARLTNYFSSEPNLDIVVKDTEPDALAIPPVPEIKLKKQVFQVPQNKYTYNNARALCDAYGARLATYNEVENAYKNGAEWCSYGWTEGQMALFPTQKKTWKYLQGVKGHENDCGRPGINGGYIANPNVKFGATCYGYKPKATETELDIMDNTPIYPKSLDDIKYQKKVDYWKKRIPEILVAPFNKSVWSLV